MKPINKLKTIFGLTLTFALILLASCENESLNENEALQQIDLKSQIEEDELTKIENLLADLKVSIDNSSKKLGDFEAMTFELVRNNDTGEITIENLKVESFFPTNNTNRFGNYQIDCDLGGDGSNNWSESCSGPVSCVKLAKKCLDQGGCATVCDQKAAHANINSVKMTYIANLK